VPLDVNWEPRDGGQMFVELKAWRGTRGPWPMAYVAETRSRPAGDFPEHWSKVPATGGFAFAGDRIRVRGSGLGELTLQVPDPAKGAAIEDKSPLGTAVFTVWRTALDEGGRSVPGWLIHEHIRLDQTVKLDTSKPFFERFHWFPLVKGEDFYLLRHDSQRGQLAARWRSVGGRLETQTSERVDLTVTARAPEPKSGRAAVPQAWTLAAPAFDLSVKLATGAGHDGQGPARPSGKALYRQALVTGDAHGMVELILED
jgi:hypothetical protein